MLLLSHHFHRLTYANTILAAVAQITALLRHLQLHRAHGIIELLVRSFLFGAVV